MPRSRTSQFGILLRKNALLSIRNWKSTALLILAPLAFNLLLAWIAALIEGGEPTASPVESVDLEALNMQIPRCTPGPGLDSCYAFAYYPNDDADINALVAQILDDQGLESSDAYGVANETALNEFLLNNPNTTQAAIWFSAPYSADMISSPTSPGNFGYSIQFNASIAQCSSGGFTTSCWDIQQDLVLPMQVAVESAVIATRAAGLTEVLIEISSWAFPRPITFFEDLESGFGSIFWFSASMFALIIQTIQMVGEKEAGLRSALKMIGAKDIAFWGSWFVTNLVLVLLSNVVLFASGMALGMNFFLKSDLSVLVTLFGLFGLNIIAMVFLLTTLIGSSRSAFNITFFIWIVFILFNSFVEIFYIEELGVSDFYLNLFTLLPPVQFVKVLGVIGGVSTGAFSEGLRWEDIDTTPSADFWPVSASFTALTCTFFGYMALAWYFDNVLARNGNSRPLWFFLTPKYWLNQHGNIAREGNPNVRDVPWPADEDVKAENDLVASGQEPEHTLLSIRNLSRVFFRSVVDSLTPNPSSAKIEKDGYVAVRNLNLHVADKELLALLGPNGAGKTTTISMLTGLLNPSGGDAFVCGHSIVSDMDAVRDVIGVSPQFDVLWNEMTAREHITMFAKLKGVPREDIEKEVVDRISEVDLMADIDRPAGTYSGGMKRRLSLAVALTGSPQVVFLDEPTTGMDPVSRRKVWDVLEAQKKQRAIVLTTHSMEEADILGDRIAVIALGRLRAHGTAIRLKNRFGAGYRLTVVFETKDKDGAAVSDQSVSNTALGRMRDVCPSLEVVSQTNSIIIMTVPRKSQEDLPKLFSLLDNDGEALMVSDYSVSLTTLEEVFLNLAKKADEERPLEKATLAHGEDPATAMRRLGFERSTSGMLHVPTPRSGRRSGSPEVPNPPTPKTPKEYAAGEDENKG